MHGSFERRKIGAEQAYKWRDIELPQSLMMPTRLMARQYGLELPKELPPGCEWLRKWTGV